MNALSIPEKNNLLIPNDRNHRGNCINDFKNTSHSTNANFLDWKLNGSFKSKYGHSMFVQQGQPNMRKVVLF